MTLTPVPEEERSYARPQPPAQFALPDGLAVPNAKVPTRVSIQALQDLVALACDTVDDARGVSSNDVVTAKLDEGKLHLTVRIVVTFGRKLADVSAEVDEAVRKQIADKSGLPIGAVQIEIAGIEAGRETRNL